MESTNLPRMRTIAKTVSEIKALDPNTEVTGNYIRQLVKSGDLPVVWAGNKALINLDNVLDLLRLGTTKKQAEIPTVNGIRRVDLRRPS